MMNGEFAELYSKLKTDLAVLEEQNKVHNQRALEVKEILEGVHTASDTLKDIVTGLPCKTHVERMKWIYILITLGIGWMAALSWMHLSL